MNNFKTYSHKINPKLIVIYIIESKFNDLDKSEQSKIGKCVPDHCICYTKVIKNQKISRSHVLNVQKFACLFCPRVYWVHQRCIRPVYNLRGRES